MARIRRGIPNNVAKSRRVVLPFTKTDRLMSSFGFLLGTNTQCEPEVMKEIFAWVRDNCTGQVYHVEYYAKTTVDEDKIVWEFFFNSDGEAALFKLRFC